MVDSQWSKDYWANELDNCMVVVCTAAILQKLLAHSYLRIDQINLLIFDECHHAKKNHPYARIIKDFYMRVPAGQRPRILGMTASPVDAQTDIHYAAQELETILHSEIATVHEALLASSGGYHLDRHTEYRERYPKLRPPYETGLCEAIKAVMPPYKHSQKMFTAAHVAASELGPWCADRLWQIRLTDDEVVRLKAKAEKHNGELNYAFAAQRDTSTGVDRALELVRNLELEDPLPNLDFISPKVLHLRLLLQENFSEPNDNRCIVFVEQRVTALLLQELFDHDDIKPSFLKAAAIVCDHIPLCSHPT